MGGYKTVFPTSTIQEITEAIIDYRGKTPEKTKQGIKLITAKIIKEGAIQNGEHEFIDENHYDEWMRRGLPRQWDILITTEAPLGEVAQIRTTERVALAQRVILLRGNPHIIDQNFFYQALKSPYVQAELYQRSTGTTVFGIKQSELRQVNIPMPPLPIQRKIAAILSAYDDLIEINTRRIKLLEEMAQALYREWFVEFRFPGHEQVRMVESPLGMVPEGWEVRKLGEIVDINPESIKPNNPPNFIHYIDIASVSPGSIELIQLMRFEKAPGRARRIVKDGDIIWSTVRPNRRSFALILNPKPNLTVSTGFAVLRGKEVPFSYLYNATKTDDFVQYLTNNAKGSAYPAVSSEDFNNYSLLVPNKIILKKYHLIANDICWQIQNLNEQNSNLRQTRDLLLPKLISGALDVSELEIAGVEGMVAVG